ncbi:MAG TPA: DUF4398 domain-containing protein [Xanthomonadales bacterium]|nr:DUF4398 domain-containing protein [Xanthomonadales bacterium]
MKPEAMKLMTAVLAGTLLTAAGCASAPDKPEQQLARAEASIEFAEQNDAGKYGDAALDRAREHLESAERAAESGKYEVALESAEKAELDAELAAAQANTQKAEIALQEIRASIEVLRREIARKGIS